VARTWRKTFKELAKEKEPAKEMEKEYVRKVGRIVLSESQARKQLIVSKYINMRMLKSVFWP